MADLRNVSMKELKAEMERRSYKSKMIERWLKAGGQRAAILEFTIASTMDSLEVAFGYELDEWNEDYLLYTERDEPNRNVHGRFKVVAGRDLIARSRITIAAGGGDIRAYFNKNLSLILVESDGGHL